MILLLLIAVIPLLMITFLKLLQLEVPGLFFSVVSVFNFVCVSSAIALMSMVTLCVCCGIFHDVNGVKGLIVVSVDARSLGVFVALVFVVATSLVDCIISVVVGVVRDVVVCLDVAGVVERVVCNCIFRDVVVLVDVVGVVECVLRDLFVLAAGVLFDVVGVVDRVLLDVAAFAVVVRGFAALLDVVRLFDLPF